MNKVESQLRLFKTYIGENTTNYNEHALKYSVLISDSASKQEVDKAIELYGVDPEQLNKTFHKSIKTVLETPIEVLYIQQLIHYFTTYGLESIGICNPGLVYIPHEKLEIPELNEDIKLTYIKGVTEQELKESILNIVTSGIALSKQTVDDIIVLSDYIDKSDVEKVENREVKTYLYEKYNIIPLDPTYLLRRIISNCSNQSLLIQNDYTYNLIKNCNILVLYTILNEYVIQHGLTPIAEIFLRYKKLFLAMKRNVDDFDNATNRLKAITINSYINKIKKLSKQYHIPTHSGILDKITDTNENISLAKLSKSLSKVNNYRLIRLLNCLNYRINSGNETPIVYKIRNGRVFIEDMKPYTDKQKETLLYRYKVIKAELVSRIKDKIKDKKVILPNNIEYIVPQSEKQYSDNIPDGSYVKLDKSDKHMIVGVNWHDVDGERVDLDLHLQNDNSHFGWNASYRCGNVVYSGDITSAPEGATEVFWLGKDNINVSYLLSVLCYTQNLINVPFKFFIADCEDSQVERNYMVNPNNIKLMIN